MKKKWKILSTLCLAALLGFMIPVNAIKAAEENATVQLKYQGQNITQSMGGTIEYNLYIKNCDQSVDISINQSSSLTSLSYYLDKGGSTESKSEEQLDSFLQVAESSSNQSVLLGPDGKYVLYVKAEADNGQVTCVRTVGIVVDSVPPEIIGIQDGGTCSLGTKFKVKDDNLDKVLVNQQEALPDKDGLYEVAANGTSCVIKAIDKAEHETTCSITISEESGNPGGDNTGDDKPQDDKNVITTSGTYSLKAGTAYRFGNGNWTLEGDSVVYRGGITFYVNKDGDYSFKHY